MDKVVVFEFEGAVAVLSAATGIGMSILDVGKKDAPAGIPFWIVESSTITDTYAIAPEVIGEPLGYGGTYQPTPLEV
ncbi:TPA: hypothetical protein I8Y10_004084 [Kluyvera cryocrescens]|nr:hypothetical protein [Kluyvera cryocrescens]